MIIQSIRSNHPNNTIRSDLEDDNMLQLWTPSEFQNHSTEEQDIFVEHLGMSGWSSVFAEAIGKVCHRLKLHSICMYICTHACMSSDNCVLVK